MTCEEINQRLIDYLYAELSAPEKAAFVQHLETCSSCRALTKSFEETLLDTRASLAGPLDEFPPARLHQRILAAAQKSEVRSPPETQPVSGFFTSIFRTPWFLPVCGATAIGALLLITRMDQPSEIIPLQAPTPLDEIPTIPPATDPGLLPSSNEQPLRKMRDIDHSSPAKEKYRTLAKDAPSRVGSKGLVKVQAPRPENSKAVKKLARIETRVLGNKLGESAEVAALYMASPPSPSEKAAPVQEAVQAEGSAIDELLRDADAHYRAERWSSARKAYQDLIRRFPQHEEVPNWRKRLKQAMDAEAALRPPQPSER